MNIDYAEAERMLASAETMLKERSEAVAKAAHRLASASSLAALVNAQAEAEGAHQAIKTMRAALAYAERTGEPVDVRGELTGALLSGADDSWSGLGNDVRRAKFDGFREQAGQLLRAF